MKTIRILDEDGCIRVFNPMHVKDIMMIPPGDDGLDYGVVLNFDNGSSVAKSFNSKDKAEVFFKYADECMKSI